MPYIVDGATAATAATDAHAIWSIWNPSTTRWVRLLELLVNPFAAPGAGAGFVFRRISARGTAGSTVTPAAANHDRNQAVPDSGFLLDLAAFTVQPTLVAGELHPSWVFPAVTASGLWVPLRVPIEIGPGTGLACCNRAAIAFPTSEIGAALDEM